MSLNQFMHHRNPYKNKKPNFKDLAIKYEDFRKHVTQDLSGNIHLDFKNAECQRALTATLLKEDFQLEVELPLDRLIPTVPQRLNYILWLEDIFQGKPDGLRGIDIGTGACCIYPLLACRKNGWSFLATEVDDINIHYANKNITKNSFTDKIKVEKVADEDLLVGVLGDGHESYDFCMCNPPFFGSLLESQGVLSTRTEERALPSSFSTASIGESVCQGGEVHFVKRIIQDSLKLRDRVRVYTSLVGKKSSLPALKAELRDNNITNFSTTQFSQGRTMRWAIAWSFDQHIELPKPVKKPCKKSKAKGPLEYIVPKSLTDVNYTVLSIGNRIRTILKELQIPHSLDKISASKVSLQVCARHDTWSHQRRKRRQLAREQQLKVKVARQEPTASVTGSNATESSESSGDSKDESMEIDEENAKMQNTGTIEKEVEGPKEESRVEVCTDSNDSKNDVLQTESGKDAFHSNTHKPTIKGDNDDTELKGLKTSKCELNNVAEMVTSAPEKVSVSEHWSSSPLDSTLGENKKAELSGGKDKNQNITSNTKNTLPSGGGDKNQIGALPSGGGDKNQSVAPLSGGGDKDQTIALPSGGEDKNQSIVLPSGREDKHQSAALPSGGGDKNQSTSLPSGVGDKNQRIALPSGSQDKNQSRELPSGGGDKNQQSDECVLKCTLNIKSSGEDVVLQMVWIDGTSQETMYQVLQHIKNKLNSK